MSVGSYPVGGFVPTHPGKETIMAADDFVSVSEAPNPTEHLLLQSLLEANGIEARLEGTEPTGTAPDSAASMARSTLFVPAKDADRARQLLKDAEAGRLADAPLPAEEAQP